jgi:HlyD family secretion protein
MFKKLKQIPWTVILSVLGLLLAAYYIYNTNKPVPRPAPLHAPSSKTLDTALVGTGLVEAAEENMAVPPYRTGKVVKVWVTEGQKITQGQPLYTLDTRSEAARLATVNAQMGVQQAVLSKLQHEPRQEEVPPLKAAVAQAKANWQDQLTQLKRLESVTLEGAVSQDELSKKRYAVQSAKAQLDQAQKQLAKTVAGTSQWDLKKARADVNVLNAQQQEQQVILAQSVVRAPKAGTVLQVNIRPGEVANTTSTVPPVLIGNTQQLQIRVDIDEVNANRVRPGMPAVAILRGNTQYRFKLAFNRIIPYMVPKKNLSGSPNERVDVRVLQLIYTFTPPAFPVYVGQQVDVYLFDPNKPVNWSEVMTPPAIVDSPIASTTVTPEPGVLDPPPQANPTTPPAKTP